MSIVLIFVLAVIVEGIIEYLGAPLPARWKPHTAALLAIAACLGYGADIIAVLLGATARVPFWGEVFTGLAIGRGSNYIHDLWQWIQVVKVPAKTVDEVMQKDEKDT